MFITIYCKNSHMELGFSIKTHPENVKLIGVWLLRYLTSKWKNTIYQETQFKDCGRRNKNLLICYLQMTSFFKLKKITSYQHRNIMLIQPESTHFKLYNKEMKSDFFFYFCLGTLHVIYMVIWLTAILRPERQHAKWHLRRSQYPKVQVQ